jgi:hypothetical protein
MWELGVVGRINIIIINFKMAIMAFCDSGFNFLKLMNLFGHLVGLLGPGIGRMQGLSLHMKIQHRKTWTHIHASSGIQTQDPNV